MTVNAGSGNGLVMPGWIVEWWPVLLGLAALFIPTYFDLVNGIWTTEDQAHGPIVLMVVFFLIWQQRYLFTANSEKSVRGNYFSGSVLIVVGLICYILGRSQEILMLEIASQIPIFSGVLLVCIGVRALQSLWFPLFFLVFMIPLPGFILDAVTLPMKMAVSYVAEQFLYWADYPIARSGVTLQIGQYQLLVADACAGMHTLISLEALGLLYLNLVKHDSFLRNLILAVLIIPISFTANVIRVIVLTLITFYFGDEVGQGFVHGFAGILLFIVALSMIIAIDTAIQAGIKRLTSRIQPVEECA